MKNRSMPERLFRYLFQYLYLNVEMLKVINCEGETFVKFSINLLTLILTIKNSVGISVVPQHNEVLFLYYVV